MDERVNIDEEHRFVHWVEDPAGQLFCVQGVTSFGVSGPVSLAAPGRGALVRRLLAFVNKRLVGVQRPRTHEGLHLEVTRIGGAGHETVLDEQFDDPEQGRQRADTLVARIEAGTFTAPRTLGA